MSLDPLHEKNLYLHRRSSMLPPSYLHLSSAATALFDCDALSSHYQSGVLQQYVLLLMSYNVTGLHDCACMLDWHDKQLLLFPARDSEDDPKCDVPPNIPGHKLTNPPLPSINLQLSNREDELLRPYKHTQKPSCIHGGVHACINTLLH